MALLIKNTFAAASKRSVACRAVGDVHALGRRIALGGLVAGAAVALAPRRAMALIPDEEDEELLEKAKVSGAITGAEPEVQQAPPLQHSDTGQWVVNKQEVIVPRRKGVTVST